VKIPKLAYVSREKYLLDMARGKKSLHLGCVGDRKLLKGEMPFHEKLACVCEDLWGIDINKTGLELLKKFPRTKGGKLFHGDITKLEEVFPTEKFELIIAADVIEHLVNPAQMLHSAKSVLSKDGILVITTPNALGLLNVLRAGLKKEAVNPEHTMWFSFSTFDKMARECGWVIKKFLTGYDHEPGEITNKIKYMVGKQFFKVFPQWGGTLIAALELSE